MCIYLCSELYHICVDSFEYSGFSVAKLIVAFLIIKNVVIFEILYMLILYYRL